jgi:hypothetical protein
MTAGRVVRQLPDQTLGKRTPTPLVRMHPTLLSCHPHGLTSAAAGRAYPGAGLRWPLIDGRPLQRLSATRRPGLSGVVFGKLDAQVTDGDVCCWSSP